MNLISRAIDKVFRSFKALSHKSIMHRNKKVRDRIEEIRRSVSDRSYIVCPKVTVIVQFFNKRRNIQKLLENLRLANVEEIIIIDDGSIDGSYEDWLKVLDRPNDFLLRCNDIFEVRTYDRAIRMARGEFVCLLQDDDLPPSNNLWVEQAMNLFTNFPKLLILGGRDGMDTLMPDFNELPDFNGYYERVGNICEWKNVHKLKLYWEHEYLEPESQIPFRFTIAVNRAPTFLRRKEFLEIGGINQKYAPFQLDDDDACIRAWKAGYQVGFYPANFIRDFDIGGMTLFNTQNQKELILRNAKQLYTDHGQEIADGSLQTLVDIANSNLIPRS